MLTDCYHSTCQPRRNESVRVAHFPLGYFSFVPHPCHNGRTFRVTGRHWRTLNNTSDLAFYVNRQVTLCARIDLPSW